MPTLNALNTAKNTIQHLLLTSFIASSGISAASDVNISDKSLSALEEEILWLQEETYVTTATKTLEDIKKSGATVSVITASDLKNMGARNLMDALKRLPGIGIQTSNIGIPTVEVRGVKTDNSEKVLFLINGHAVNNNLVNGGATWAYRNFQVDEIKRVEIVRGPGSALYGTNAFVAVINIVTFSASDINSSEITVGIGKNATKSANLQIADSTSDIHYALNLRSFETEGLDQKVSSDGASNSGQTNDWERSYDLGFKLGTGNFSLQGKYIDRSSGPFIGIGNALNDESKQAYIEYFVELSYAKDISEQLAIKTKLYHDHFEANNFWEIFSEGHPGTGFGPFPNGALGSPTVQNEKVGGELQLEYNISASHRLLAGATFEHQTQFDVRHSTNFDPTTPLSPLPVFEDVSSNFNWNGSHRRDVSAVYLQDIWDVNEQLRLIIGARRDRYSDVGSSFNPRSSLTWEFIEDYNLTMVYGQAFRAPSFGELYNINNPAILGDPDIEPEEIETFEVSVDGKLDKRTQFRITGFKNNIRDAIDFNGGIARNADKLEINGLELELDRRLRNGSGFELNYTYQYPINKENNRRSAEIPLHKANAAFSYFHSQYFNAYLGALYRSSLGRVTGDPRADVADTVTVDLALNWREVINMFNITASVYNLLDKKYVDAAARVSSDFPTPDRNFMITASYKL